MDTIRPALIAALAPQPNGRASLRVARPEALAPRWFIMPRYRFHCRSCDLSFDEIVWPSEMDTPMRCPECGESDDVEKELGRFAVGAATPPQEPPPFCGRCGQNRPPCGA